MPRQAPSHSSEYKCWAQQLRVLREEAAMLIAGRRRAIEKVHSSYMEAHDEVRLRFNEGTAIGRSKSALR